MPSIGAVASPGRRLAGYFADLATTALFWLAIMYLSSPAYPSYSEGLAIVAALYGVVFVVGGLVLMAKGKSFGKLFLGMRVFHVSGKPAGFFTMLVRDTIGRFISGLVLSLGYLWLLWDKDRQTWHDKLLGTVVMVQGKAAQLKHSSVSIKAS
jgi:uncharacterized RDD family membrane protein YckC